MKKALLFLAFAFALGTVRAQTISIKSIPFAPDSVAWNNATFARNNKLGQYAANFCVTPGSRVFFVDKNLKYQFLASGASLSITNSLTGTGSAITSTVNGQSATLTPPAGTVAQRIGFSSGGALVKESNATTNTLTGTGSAITSTVNGQSATLTPAAGTIAQRIGFSSGGTLVKESNATTNEISAANGDFTIGTQVNGVVAAYSVGESSWGDNPPNLITFFDGSGNMVGAEQTNTISAPDGGGVIKTVVNGVESELIPAEGVNSTGGGFLYFDDNGDFKKQPTPNTVSSLASVIGLDLAHNEWALKSVSAPLSSGLITASTTFLPVYGALYYVVELMGGGGGSGGVHDATATQLYVSSAGAGGGYCRAIVPASAVTGGVSVTIGAGGAAGTGGSSSTSGTQGGTTSFGAFCSAAGGNGGDPSTLVTSTSLFLSVPQATGGSVTVTTGDNFGSQRGGLGGTGNGFNNGTTWAVTTPNGGQPPTGGDRGTDSFTLATSLGSTASGTASASSVGGSTPGNNTGCGCHGNYAAYGGSGGSGCPGSSGWARVTAFFQ